MIVVERAISLTQPWATLVAIGAKRYETRSWRTNYRGWLAIHAAKEFPKACERLCWQQNFASALGLGPPGHHTSDLPRGQVIAVVELVDCKPTGNYSAGVTESSEIAFGDYSPGRFAWKLENVRRVLPKEAKGALGIWRLPPELQWVIM